MKKHVGAPMSARSNTQGLFSTVLWAMAQKLLPNERVVVRKKQGRPALKQDLTDEQVAECRRAHEAGEASCNELALAHGVPYRRMYAILTYRTRSARTDVRKPA